MASLTPILLDLGGSALIARQRWAFICLPLNLISIVVAPARRYNKDCPGRSPASLHHCSAPYLAVMLSLPFDRHKAFYCLSIDNRIASQRLQSALPEDLLPARPNASLTFEQSPAPHILVFRCTSAMQITQTQNTQSTVQSTCRGSRATHIQAMPATQRR